MEIVKRFITDRGKIVPKRNSGVCAKHQRLVSNTVKRARYTGYIPYTSD
jgi:small subunit ribosomal protein S18